MTGKLSLTVQYIIKDKSLPSRYDFRRWVKAALQPNCLAAEITLRLVDRDEALSLNTTYRHKAYPTNVLTFDFAQNLLPTLPVFGDIVLCVPVIAQEAQMQNKSILAHYAHLVVHGVLHLQGYDHIIETEADKMETLEIQVLQQQGFTNPYISL